LTIVQDPRALESAAPRDGAPKRSPQRHHFEFIDGLRAVCALFVLLGHTWFQPSSGYYPQRWMNLLGLSYGHLAVVVFIVVSGFVITYPITTRGDDVGSWLQFYKRRARRILPPYYAALVLSAVFILATGQHKTGTVWDFSLPLTWGQLLTHFGMINNLPLGVPGGAIGYQFWSIAVEFQIYLLTPFLVLGIRRIGFWAVVALSLVAAAAFVLLLPAWRDAHVWFVGLFLFGAGAARIVALRPEWGTRAGYLGLLVLLPALAFTAKQGSAWFGRNLPWIDTIIGAGAALLIAGLTVGSGRVLGALKAALSLRWLVWIGTFSYSLYLVHAALLHAFWLLISKVSQPSTTLMFALLVLCAPLIVALSWLFFVAFERPFMRPATVKPATTQASYS
jgi:peptidoglycan/LPS O-acetylase OafA/YrhL